MQDSTSLTKLPIELMIDASLLDEAKARQLDLATVLERAIRREQLGSSAAADTSSGGDAWRRENAEAIKTWNEDLWQSGLWSDGLRSF